MFKLRLISTLVLLPLAIAGILYLPAIFLQILSAVVLLIAAMEWLNITSVEKYSRGLFIALAATIALVASLLMNGMHPLWFYFFSLIWWLCALIGICYYPKYQDIWREKVIQPITGLIMFVPPWLAFNSLVVQKDGPIWVLLACALIWGSDIGAYCCGKLWGKAKLLPHVSPNKTWVGLWGGIGTGCILMLLFHLWFSPYFSLYAAFGLALVTVIFAVIGDLFESMIKRIYKVKDSGKIIPGHGGMYDRIDSMLAAFPIFYLCLSTLHDLNVIKL